MTNKAISLFSSSGIGDLALRANGIEVILANELIRERAELFQVNFPETELVHGDIWDKKSEIIQKTKSSLGGDELDVLLATPPCQGMSKNGQGKLLSEIRAGRRPRLDPRNRLIIPTLEIATALRPRILILENVPEMTNTVIEDESGDLVKILDYVEKVLGGDYSGRAETVEFADFGVPQRRKRLITIFTRDPILKSTLIQTGSLIAPATHANGKGNGLFDWVTLRETIGSLPTLDAVPGKNACEEFSQFHRVPVLDDKKYHWIQHTPLGESAFNNQCINEACGYTHNTVHGSQRTAEGINRSNTETPLHCSRCGQLLPRPFVELGSEKRLMKAFTSSYRRMRWDAPAPTLTRNLSYPSSDSNIHPDQNRVLSLFEALEIHTVNDYEYFWQKKDGQPVSDSLMRDSIGESVPPRGLEKIIHHLLRSTGT